MNFASRLKSLVRRRSIEADIILLWFGRSISDEIGVGVIVAATGEIQPEALRCLPLVVAVGWLTVSGGGWFGCGGCAGFLRGWCRAGQSAARGLAGMDFVVGGGG